MSTAVPTTGNLTDEQDKKLRAAWKQYFEILDKAKGDNKKGGGGGGGGGDGGEDVVDDPKKAGISNDDNAKEEAKKQEEQKALNELTQQYGTDALRDAFWKFCKLDDPDTCVLRFMRARKWDTDRAIAMLAGCMKWRLDNDIEGLVEQGDIGNDKNIEKFIEQHTSGKTYAFGSSVEEHPVCYIHVRKHFTKGQPPETMQKFIAYQMETFRLLLVPPNDKVVLFFDLNNFGLKNMDWSAILYIVKCLEAYFPESLHTLIIYKAPWVFSGIWKILSPMLDPVVRSKVVFMSKPSECEHLLPADRLVEELGGDVEFDWEKRWIDPKEGENSFQDDKDEKKKRFDTFMKHAGEYEEVTKKWADGSSDKEVLEKRRLLVKKLRVAQYESDVYARGRTQLHRDATLDGQGKVTWIYKLKSGEEIRHVVGRQHCCAVMKREIKEMEEDNKSSEDVEKKSSEALNNSDWVALYGSEELAQKLEGSRVDGQTPDVPEDNSKAVEVANVPAGSVQGPPKGGASGGDVAESQGQDRQEGGDGAEAAPAAAAATGGAVKSGGEDFHDAPVAEKQTIEKAVSRDHIAAPQDEQAKPAQEPPAAETTNGNANGTAENGSGKSTKDTLKEKTVDAPKDKMDKLGSKFKGLMSKVK